MSVQRGDKFTVLNHGHVVLMDYMGNDEAVVEAARTAYQKGTVRVSDDRTLIRFLMRSRHTSPFESVQLKFHIKLPIFVERQWARHRTAGWNEVSARYSELPEEYYVPDSDVVREQSNTNKQGRGDEMGVVRAEEFRQDTVSISAAAFTQYHVDLADGMARELARINLPLGTYTEKVWWINLKNLLDFLALRMDSHAQLEIRQYATIIGEQIIKPLFPMVWEAFEDYRLGAMVLTRLDIKVMEAIIAEMGAVGYNQDDTDHMAECPEWYVWENVGWTQQKCRERDECIVKLKRLGLVT